MEEDLQVDHIIPTYMGGSDELHNVQTLCKSCHRKKTSKDAANPQYNDVLRRRIEAGRGRKSRFPRGWLVPIMVILTITMISALAL